ncbi:MAG: CBS domain-containing protein [Thermodesulfobacteriota bacterium]
MLIEEWMSRPVHTVKPLDTISHARELMVRHRVNQLPVVRDGRLIGIVTDRDLRDAFPSVFTEIDEAIARDFGEPRRRRTRARETDPGKVPVDMVMSHDPMSLSPRDSVEEAARLMRRERFGALPIVDGGALVGILTRSDVLDAFLGLAESMAEVSGA